MLRLAVQAIGSAAVRAVHAGAQFAWFELALLRELFAGRGRFLCGVAAGAAAQRQRQRQN